MTDSPAATCLICGEPTTSTKRAAVGQRTGVACDDCAYWCDGNLISGTGSSDGNH